MGGGRYINAAVAQSSVASLLESLAVLGQAGCLAHLPTGAQFAANSAPLSTLDTPIPVSGGSKASLVARVSAYLTLPLMTVGGNSSSNDIIIQLASHQRVWFASLRTLACLCTGETAPMPPAAVGGKKKAEAVATTVSPHPHLTHIIRCMCSVEDASSCHSKCSSLLLRLFSTENRVLPPPSWLSIPFWHSSFKHALARVA